MASKSILSINYFIQEKNCIEIEHFFEEHIFFYHHPQTAIWPRYYMTSFLGTLDFSALDEIKLFLDGLNSCRINFILLHVIDQL